VLHTETTHPRATPVAVDVEIDLAVALAVVMMERHVGVVRESVEEKMVGDTVVGLPSSWRHRRDHIRQDAGSHSQARQHAISPSKTTSSPRV